MSVVGLVRTHTGLDEAQAEHLHRLVVRWHLLADLWFSDLLLWVPVAPALRDEIAGHLPGGAAGAFLSVAQVRPATGPTAHPEDRVGAVVTSAGSPLLAAAAAGSRPPRGRAGDASGAGAAVPVRHHGAVVAVLSRTTGPVRGAGRLEAAYRRAAAALEQQVAAGRFPPEGQAEPGPSVGDGTLLLGRDGAVLFASPNARSALRRLGLVEVERGPLLERLAGLAPSLALSTSTAAGAEVEADGTVVQLSVVPLQEQPAPDGPAALLLLRDVTELRARDRRLLTLDATVREVHHRVKNNLQTVAALLRLQARRTEGGEARAALAEAVRRVGAIALVHETLSTAMDDTVVLDLVVDRLLVLVGEVVPSEAAVELRRSGSAGAVPGDVATPLVLAVSELLQNALEHGVPGTPSPAPEGDGPAAQAHQPCVEVRLLRDEGRLEVEVLDDGPGLPADGPEPGLGLQIVRGLVEGEMSGALRLTPRSSGRGTSARLVVPLGGDGDDRA